MSALSSPLLRIVPDLHDSPTLDTFEEALGDLTPEDLWMLEEALSERLYALEGDTTGSVVLLVDPHYLHLLTGGMDA